MKIFPGQIIKHRKSGSVYKVIQKLHHEAMLKSLQLDRNENDPIYYLSYDLIYKFYDIISVNYIQYWNEANL